MRRELLNFSCSSEMKEDLRMLSKRTGAAVAWHVRKALEEYLEREEVKGGGK